MTKIELYMPLSYLAIVHTSSTETAKNTNFVFFFLSVVNQAQHKNHDGYRLENHTNLWRLTTCQSAQNYGLLPFEITAEVIQ